MTPPRPASTSRLHRSLIGLMAAAALCLGWWEMQGLDGEIRWDRDATVNFPTIVNALAFNSGVQPARVEDPGLVSQLVLAADLRMRHELGRPVWNFRRLDMSADPVAELADLSRVSREHSRFMVLAFVLLAAALCWHVTRSLETTGLAVTLLGGSAGLIYHGLGCRPELLATGCGVLLAPFCLWQAGTSAGSRRPAWLFAAGIACGLAVLDHRPAALYLAVVLGWTWLDAGRADVRSPSAGADPASRWLLPLASALATLGLLHVLGADEVTTDGTALLRLRVGAVAVALLPLLVFAPGPLAAGRLLRHRLADLALTAGGALGSLSLAGVALHVVMPAPVASAYFGQLLQSLFHPAAAYQPSLSETASHAAELLPFLRSNPFLLAGSLALATALATTRVVPPPYRAWTLLLLAEGLALGFIGGRFAESHALFTQVPVLLAWAVALHGAGIWRTVPAAGPRPHWAVPVVLVASLVLLATLPLRLRPRLLGERAAPGTIDDYTVTCLYNHNALPDSYVAAMKRHYPARLDFVQALQRNLAGPGWRP